MGIWCINNNTNACPIAYGSANTNQAFGFQQFNTNGVTFRFFGYANDYDVTVPAMFNRWVYMVGTFDGTNAEVWVNGVSYGRSNRSTWNTVVGTNSLQLGRTFFPGNYLNGSIPVAHIYNRVLTADEIMQNFNYYKPRYL